RRASDLHASHAPRPERPPVAAVDRRLRQVQCSSTFLWTVPSSRSTTTEADIGGDALVGDPVHFPAQGVGAIHAPHPDAPRAHRPDRKSTRLTSSHVSISYAVFCLKKNIPCD